MSSWRRPARGRRGAILGIAALAVVTLALAVAAFAKPSIERAGMAQESPLDHVLSTGSATPSAAQTRFAAVGDSITVGDSPDFSAGRTGSLSWVTYVARTPGLVFVGGWADGDAKTDRMAANAKPVKADVLAMIAGTNDYSNGVPFSDTEVHLDQIVKTVGASRVVISSVPPYERAPAEAVAYNTKLESFVKSRGWTWVDAAAGLRDGDHYKAGLTLDGTHPTAEAAKILGAAIAQTVQQHS